MRSAWPRAMLSLSAAQLVAAIDTVQGKLVVPPSDASAVTARGVFAWVINPQGQVEFIVGRSQDAVPPVSSGNSQVQLASGEEARLLRVPLNDTGGQVVVGASLDSIEQTSRFVALTFVALTPIVLGLSALGGAFLAGRALAPISKITAQAQRIGRDNLSERLSLVGPADEVHTWAATFDDMLDRIERAFESERRFTSDASHELRTPLGLLKTQLSLAVNKPREAVELRSMILAMEGDLDRMTRLVERMLTLSLSEQPLTQRDPVDLSNLLGALVTQFQTAAAERRLDLSLSAPSSALVLGDADRLTQLFLNVLDNAMKYTNAGGSIRVSLEPAKDEWRIAIADSGSGISAEHLPHIFDRFYRTDVSRARQTGGSGLGLAIVQAITHQHAGVISVESVLGRGSIFTVILPRILIA